MIRCPSCGFDAIYVVEATLASTGDVLTFAPATVALEAEGFYFSLPVHEDSSTTAEVAECAACGRRGPLADFGFGEEEIAEEVVWPCAEHAQEVTLRLTVTVRYRTDGATQRELADLLERAALHAAEEGLLIGESPAEVLTWQADVAEVISESFALLTPHGGNLC